jgi:hypothetical protein
MPSLRGKTSPGPAARHGKILKLLEQPKLLEATTTCDAANTLSDVRV